MVRVNYNIILESYESINAEIDREFSEYTAAMEASTEDMVQGTTTNGNDQTASNDDTKSTNTIDPAKKSKFISMLQKIIDKIAVLIDAAKRKINNNMKLMWQTDRGFRSALVNAQRNNKPLKGFNALTYQYDEAYLDRTMQSLMSGFLDEFQRIGTANLIGEDADNENFDFADSIKNIFNKANVDSGIETVDQLTREMISKFRGDKEEVTFSQSQIPALQQIVSKGSSSSAFADYMKPIEQRYNDLKSKAARFRQVHSDADMKRVSAAMNCVTKLYNAALTISKVYYELKVERYLAAREALKKFYAIT